MTFTSWMWLMPIINTHFHSLFYGILYNRSFIDMTCATVFRRHELTCKQAGHDSFTGLLQTIDQRLDVVFQQRTVKNLLIVNDIDNLSHAKTQLNRLARNTRKPPTKIIFSRAKKKTWIARHVKVTWIPGLDMKLKTSHIIERKCR